MSDWKDLRKLEFEFDKEQRQLDYFAQEMPRLRNREVEYERLLTLVSVVAEQNPLDGTVTISVTKKDQVAGKDWREILELAYLK